MTITSEDFARWRDDAVTRWVFKAIEASIDDQKALWLAKSWELNDPKPGLLIELRTRADAYRSLIEIDYKGWANLSGEEPIYDER